MSHDIAFLHTAEVHIQTFEKLVKQTNASLNVHHLVDATLLSDAVANGITDNLRARVVAAMNAAAISGVRVVVCTCSTIGGIAENALSTTPTRSMRIDRAMADIAVENSQKILVLAAVDSTLAPTKNLIDESSVMAGNNPEIYLRLIPDAWPLFEAGRMNEYYDCIAAYINQESKGYDCVILAQASMAPAAKRFDGSKILVLASPYPGVRSAISFLDK